MASARKKYDRDAQFQRISRELKKMGKSGQDIIEVLAEGEHTAKEIGLMLGLEESTVLNFLEVLQRLGLVEEEVR